MFVGCSLSFMCSLIVVRCALLVVRCLFVVDRRLSLVVCCLVLSCV